MGKELRKRLIRLKKRQAGHDMIRTKNKSAFRDPGSLNKHKNLSIKKYK